MRNVHRLITLGSILVGALLLLGVISAFFTPSIQAALTLATTHTIPPVVPPTAGPTKGVMSTTIVTQPVATPTRMATMVLAQDTFQRNDQRFWGTATNGQLWGGLANSSSSFSILGHVGIISNGQGAFDATLGSLIMDADIVFSGSVSQFGMSNIGAVLRWTDTNNWYKAYIDGTQCFLIKKVVGKITVLAAVPFAALAGNFYSMRFRIVGTMMAARIWVTGQAEPTTWLVMAKDASLQAGFGGLRIVVQNGVVAKITMFSEMTATTIQ